MTRSLSLTMRPYSVEPRTKKYFEGYGFLSFARKYKRQLLDTGLNSLKTTSKKVVDKSGKNLGNRMAEAAMNDDKLVKEELVEEKIIPPEEILNKLKQVLL